MGVIVMKDDDLINKVKTIVIDMLGVDEGKVTPDSKLREDLGADDMDLVEIVGSLIESFNIHITDDEVARAGTVKDLVNLVKSKTAIVTQ